MNLNVVKAFTCKEIERWARSHIVTGSGAKAEGKQKFIWVNTMIGNVKNALVGNCHAINYKHLPRYLAEFYYRFNRRFNLRDMMPRFLFVTIKTLLCLRDF
jgi:hypothetical protein